MLYRERLLQTVKNAIAESRKVPPSHPPLQLDAGPPLNVGQSVELALRDGKRHQWIGPCKPLSGL